MLQLLESLKHIIERFIVNITPIDIAVNKGSNTIPVASSRRYQVDDEVAIYNQSVLDSTGEGEIGKIACIPDANTIELCEPIFDSYTANDSFVQKMIGGKFIEGIYIGNPMKISHFPAITINAQDKLNEWLTLTSTTGKFNVDITIYTEAADYEKTYRLMHIYAQKIEDALFRSLFPLVTPFHVATLASPIEPNDTIIQISNPQEILGVSGFIWIESWDYLRSNRIKNVLDVDAGVFELVFPVGRSFNVGDKVIRPGRHFYDAFPRGIKYGTINQESTVFKAAVINYSASEETKRGVPFRDPLTF